MFWNELTVSPVQRRKWTSSEFHRGDVTDRKRAEEELRRSEELQRQQQSLSSIN